MSLSRIEPTLEEVEILKRLEDVFEIAKAWGYDTTVGHRGFEMRMHEYPSLGLAAQEYTDVPFRNFHRVGRGEPLMFASDVSSKFKRQSLLSETTQTALTSLVEEYLATHPRLGIRSGLAMFASELGPRSSSATHYGIRQGVAQLLAIAEGRWDDVATFRKLALERFDAAKTTETSMPREEGSGQFEEWNFWISVRDGKAGSSYHRLMPLEDPTTSKNFDGDAIIFDDEIWLKFWNAWSSSTPEEVDLVGFAEFVENLDSTEIDRTMN